MKKQNGFKVMLNLIILIKPLLAIMVCAVLMGTLGNLMATFITILGSLATGRIFGYFMNISLGACFILMAVFAVLKAFIRYAEQGCNHFIAFKILARIRHIVFKKLRELSPAKLDGKEKGNLISLITSDIEQLEVFYAHTISPVCIAILTSAVMCIWIGHYNFYLSLLALFFYITVGAIIPLINAKRGAEYGINYRNSFGKLNTTVLDNLYGLKETLQYANQNERLKKMNDCTQELFVSSKKLKKQEAIQTIITNSTILFAGIAMALLSAVFVINGKISGMQAVICTISMMSSFGPCAALSALSNNLNQTLASGKRVLSLLEEKPLTKDITNGSSVKDGNIELKKVYFSYPDSKTDETIKNFSIIFEKGKITGILGKSGCGKSTILKLLMRFYQTTSGNIIYADTNVNDINTKSLRKHISYVTQETFLFKDTIENNIKVAKPDASREEVIKAAKKASIHDFIMTLPDTYDTLLNELGEGLSGGQRQRIGIARAFLHDSKIILLDEPTSNIDSLNEAIILKSLIKEKKDKTLILVSHRSSTISIADKIKKFK